MIRPARDEPGSGKLECAAAVFGLVPPWAEMKLSRQTYNALSETLAAKPSFRSAWKRQQFCIVPVEAFFESCYDAGGKPVRWRIGHKSGQPLGVAGLWEWHRP